MQHFTPPTRCPTLPDGSLPSRDQMACGRVGLGENIKITNITEMLLCVVLNGGEFH